MSKTAKIIKFSQFISIVLYTMYILITQNRELYLCVSICFIITDMIQYGKHQQNN